VNRLLLEIVVELLPLLLQGSNKLLALLLWHKHLLTISLILLLDLHLTDKVVLVLNLSLDLAHILWHFSVVLLLQKVLILACWQFWSCEDVLNSVGDNEVLVRDQSVDWLLVLLWHSWLFICLVTLVLGQFFLWDEDWLTSSLLSESSDIWLEGALGSSHGTGASHVGVVTSLEVKLAREVGADWLGSSFESKSTCCWSKVWWILTLIALWLLWNVLLFWNQVVNALVKIDHL